jgi:hypothetical protein
MKDRVDALDRPALTGALRGSRLPLQVVIGLAEPGIDHTVGSSCSCRYRSGAPYRSPVPVSPPARPGPQWEAERTVDAACAAALIDGAFPPLRGLPVTPLGEGWDNSVFAVGGAWAFRIPRRAIAVPGFRRELAVLPAVGPRLPLPIPVPQWVGTDDDAEPWPFAGAALLQGRELAEAELPETDRQPAAAAVGGFLRVLHDPATSAAVEAALPVDPMQCAWPAARAEHTDAALDALVARGLWAGDPVVCGCWPPRAVSARPRPTRCSSTATCTCGTCSSTRRAPPPASWTGVTCAGVIRRSTSRSRSPLSAAPPGRRSSTPTVRSTTNGSCGPVPSGSGCPPCWPATRPPTPDRSCSPRPSPA